MTSAIGLANPGQITVLLILAIALPAIFIYLGLGFMKAAHKLRAHPGGFLAFSIIMSIAYLFMVAGAYHDQKKFIVIVFYGLTAVLWPVLGAFQYRAMKRARDGNGSNASP